MRALIMQSKRCVSTARRITLPSVHFAPCVSSGGTLAGASNPGECVRAAGAAAAAGCTSPNFAQRHCRVVREGCGRRPGIARLPKRLEFCQKESDTCHFGVC